MKQSFVLHKDSLCVLDKMTDERAGKFIKAIAHYQIHGELPELDELLDFVLTPFINQFVRDNRRYEAECERNRENGKTGGRPKKPKKPTGLLKTQPNPNNPIEAKKGDSDSDSEKDNDNESKYIKSEAFVKFEEWISKYAPRVLQLKEPFTEEQYTQLLKDFKAEQVRDILQDMHNYKPLLSRNVSANRTLRNWQKKRTEEKPQVVSMPQRSGPPIPKISFND